MSRNVIIYNKEYDGKKEFSKGKAYTYKGDYIGFFVEYIGVQYWGDYYWDGKAKFLVNDKYATVISKGAYVYIKEQKNNQNDNKDK